MAKRHLAGGGGPERGNSPPTVRLTFEDQQIRSGAVSWHSTVAFEKGRSGVRTTFQGEIPNNARFYRIELDVKGESGKKGLKSRPYIRNPTQSRFICRHQDGAFG